MKRRQIKTTVVRKFKTGAREGEFKPFRLPDDALILKAATVFESMVIYYAVPA